MAAIAFALTFAAPGVAAFAQQRDLSEESLPDPQAEAEASALMDTIRCVVCQGQPISGSNADLAGDMRRLVRERIAAGESPAQVRAFLVSRYGDWVSFKPRLRPATLPLWIVPLLALAGGAWLALRRLRLGRK
ncbi:MAG: cytochrome c-type biogenesis protein CcmH [Sphingomonadales bacterium]|nr:cytochrome c-type biogenesis protein CcmH [Sphingomonadales bacterium]MDE2568736.1 cytochrome c-type biogenesis protein CcmH [Sphingomonadales bacterium]